MQNTNLTPTGNGNNDPPSQTAFSRRFDDRVNKIIVKLFILLITATIPPLVLVAWNDHQALTEVKAATMGVGSDHETLVKVSLLQDQHSKDLSNKIDVAMAEEHWRLFAAQDAANANSVNQVQLRMDRMQTEINELRQQIYVQLKSGKR